MHRLLNIPVIFGYSLEVYAIMLVIALPTFFFWSWILKKHIKDSQRRKIFGGVFTIVITPIIYCGLIILMILSWSYERSRDFSKSKWLTEKEGRYEMADDLIDRKLLIGKDTLQVKNIIGEPSLRTEIPRQWTYDMGIGGGGLGFTFNSLLIKFETGKVHTVEHIRYVD